MGAFYNDTTSELEAQVVGLAMFLLTTNKEIIFSIVVLHFVDVVYGLVTTKNPSRPALCNKAVFIYPTPAMIAGMLRDEDGDVPATIAGTLSIRPVPKRFVQRADGPFAVVRLARQQGLPVR